MDFIQKKVGNGENTSFWDDSWLGEVALKVLYKMLYALKMCKSISVVEKMGHPSLSHSFRRMPKGDVEQENYGLLCSKVADLKEAGSSFFVAATIANVGGMELFSVQTSSIFSPTLTVLWNLLDEDIGPRATRSLDKIAILVINESIYVFGTFGSTSVRGKVH
uniref:RNA-directed DNA polymerase, eukaryota, reverse transcriptase zinc-binding domain protein n=1 Tax=Tanacetum cinerariifolium TaxID=118510 RepID=A0A699GPC6_TANCI|nr:RNA-directed DNA polymerase, eukaryota, reverse transcriptase zinc-binding domain protein [Tanacetum cinerariifolium]